MILGQFSEQQNNDLTKTSHVTAFVQIITHQLDISLLSQGITRESWLFEHMQLPLAIMRAAHIFRMDSASPGNLHSSYLIWGNHSNAAKADPVSGRIQALTCQA